MLAVKNKIIDYSSIFTYTKPEFLKPLSIKLSKNPTRQFRTSFITLLLSLNCQKKSEITRKSHTPITKTNMSDDLRTPQNWPFILSTISIITMAIDWIHRRQNISSSLTGVTISPKKKNNKNQTPSDRKNNKKLANLRSRAKKTINTKWKHAIENEPSINIVHSFYLHARRLNYNSIILQNRPVESVTTPKLVTIYLFSMYLAEFSFIAIYCAADQIMCEKSVG